MHVLQELTRLSTLNHAMVVRRRERDHLGNRQVGKHIWHHRLKLGWEFDGSGSDNGSLAGHQAWHRHDRTDHPGVGQRDGCPHKVIWRELVRASLADEPIVGFHEISKRQILSVLDARNQQDSGSVLPSRIHRKTKVD